LVNRRTMAAHSPPATALGRGGYADEVRKSDHLLLFDYSYWATGRILEAAQALPTDAFVAPTDITYRNLRGTLVFALDVERGWRQRIQGEPRAAWEEELPPDRFPTARSMADAWRAHETEMTAWLNGLDEAAFQETVDLGPNDRFPLWCFLLHILSHSAHQRRDAVVLLERAGQPAPELDFLYYLDARGGPPPLGHG
jgi:uncharacterized damage-inducible protein DinB